MIKDTIKKIDISFVMQIISISLIWLLVAGIGWWILRLISLSIELNDSPDLSVMISIVVIPVFIGIAGTLTYVFVGLQRYKTDKPEDAGTKDEAHR